MKTGDLIAKWAGGQTLSPGEADELRRGLNDTQSAAQRVNNLVDSAGNVTVPGSWVQLYDKVLAIETADFSVPVPPAYRHLRVVGTLRSNGSSAGADGGDSVGFQMNGDTGNTYFSSRRRNYTNSSGESLMVSSEQMNSTFLSLGGVLSNDAPANSFGTIDYFIPNYAEDANLKTIVTQAGNVRSTGSGGAQYEFGTGHWNSTSPISKLRFFPGAHGNAWMPGSRLTVYGLSE